MIALSKSNVVVCKRITMNEVLIKKYETKDDNLNRTGDYKKYNTLKPKKQHHHKCNANKEFYPK